MRIEMHAKKASDQPERVATEAARRIFLDAARALASA